VGLGQAGKPIYMIQPMHLVIASGILGLGESPSSFGQTLALLITFLGIGVLVNGIIVYVVAQVMVERRQNQERQRSPQAEPPETLG
jgi:hypothetical protein